MGRLTPFGTVVLLGFIVAAVVAVMAVTNNLRWPPFGIVLNAPATVVASPPAGIPATAAPGLARIPPAGAPQTAVAATTPAGPGSGPAPVSSPVALAASATPTHTPSNTPTNTPTATPVPPTHTPTPTATPTPLGLVYVGAIDVPGSTDVQPVAVDPTAHLLYVVSTDGQGQSVLRAYDEGSLSQQVQTSIGLPNLATDPLAPVPVLLSAATHRIYVVGGNGQVLALDSGTLALVRTYNVNQSVERAFLNPEGTKLFALQRDLPASTGPVLHVVDLHDGISSPIHLPARWSADSAFADGETLYMTGRDGLLPLDMVTIRFGGTVMLGWQPLFPVFDTTARRLYAWRQPQTVPLVPQLVVLDATSLHEVTHVTRDGCPCPLALDPARQRLYLASAGTPSHLLAYLLGDQLGKPDEMILNSVPAYNMLVSPASSRLYMQSSGPHAILVLQDNGPAAAGAGPVTVNVK